MIRRYLRSHSLLLLVVSCLLVLLPPSAAAQDSGPLTNEGVVALLSAGLGEGVVVAKIQQARKVDFRLETEDLVALSQQGVPDTVLTAMLERTSAPPTPPPGAGGAPVAGGTAMIGTPMGPMMMPGAGSDPGAVWIQADGEEIPLSGIVGEMSVTNAWVARFTFLNFVGLDAGVRIREPRPRIYLTSRDNPTGRYYLVTLDRDKDDNVRSVKMGSAGMFSGTMSNTPDRDWTMPFEVAEEGEGVWSLRPQRDLKPGEYGLLVRSSQELFDFAVDG